MYPPSEPWYEARVLGAVDTTGLHIDYPVNGHLAQAVSKLAMDELLRGVADTDQFDPLDMYLHVRSQRGTGTVRVAGIPWGTGGLHIPPPGATEALGVFWASDNGVLRAAASDPHPPIAWRAALSSVLPAVVARQLLGDGPHSLDLGEYGTIVWTPTALEVDPYAGFPNYNMGPWQRTGYQDPVGNWKGVEADDPDYAVWLWLTDPATGEPGGTGWKVSYVVADAAAGPDERVDDPHESAPTVAPLILPPDPTPEPEQPEGNP